MTKYATIVADPPWPYRVLPLDGAGHFAVELNLRDLDAEKASKV